LDEFRTAVVVAASFFAMFVFATFCLSALLYGPRVVPVRLRGVVGESLEAQGCFRVAGVLFYSALAVLLQVLVVTILLGRNGPLEPSSAILLSIELAAAVAWTVFLATRCRRALRTSV
jgi:hypothetical protein